MTVSVDMDFGDGGEVLDPAVVAAELAGTTPEGEATTTSEPSDAPVVPSEELETAAPTETQELDEFDDEGNVVLDPVQELIQKKYGGDKNKFITGLHEGWQSVSKLEQKIQELNERLSTKPEEPEAEPEIPDNIKKDIEGFNNEIAGLDRRIQAAEKKQVELVTEGRKLEYSIAKLEGKLELADDMDKPGIQRELDQAREKLEGKQEKWETKRDEKLHFESAKLQLSKQKTNAEEYARSVQAQLKTEARDARVRQQKVLSDFRETVVTEAKRYGHSEAAAERLVNSLKAEVAFKLRTGNAPADFDPLKFAKEEITSLASLYNWKDSSKVKTVTQQKLQTMTKPVVGRPSGTKPQASKPPVAERTGAFWRNRASKILG